jgi:hypothetical protein
MDDAFEAMDAILDHGALDLPFAPAEQVQSPQPAMFCLLQGEALPDECSCLFTLTANSDHMRHKVAVASSLLIICRATET